MQRQLSDELFEMGLYPNDYVKKKGGALHNKGMLVFEKDATFELNLANTRSSTDRNNGGALSNNAKGTIVFKGKLTVTDNKAQGTFEGKGGGIYNRGDIVVDGESVFTGNRAADGGAIFQERFASITFNSMATFYLNTCTEARGAAIAGFGGVVVLNSGSLFQENIADSSGEGGAGTVYCEDGCDVTFVGTTTFKDNVAGQGGGIFLRLQWYDPSVTDYELPTLTFPEDPDDLIFEGNFANDGDCPDIRYQYADRFECGP